MYTKSPSPTADTPCRDPESPVIPTFDSRTTLAWVNCYLNTLVRYAGVGIIGTGAHYLTMLALVPAIGPVRATTIGAVAGCSLNYQLARKYVFVGRSFSAFAFQKFVAVALGGVVMNTALMLLLTPYVPVVAAQLLTTAVVFVTGFVVNNTWSFGEQRA